MRKAASQLKRFKRVMIFTLIMSLFFVVQTAYAWSTSQSATAYCDTSTGKVKIKATFKNTEPANSNMGMNVVVTDEQTGNSVSLGAVAPQQTKEGTIDTGRNSIASGRVRFNLSWTNGDQGIDTRYASYNAVTCQMQTASPSPTPTATPTATPTVTPVVTASPTPVVTASPTVAPTATPEGTPRTDITDNRSDGSKDALDCVAESKYGRKECNPVVAGVSTTLPSTGGMDDRTVAYAVAAAMTFLLGLALFQYVAIEERSLNQ